MMTMTMQRRLMTEVFLQLYVVPTGVLFFRGINVYVYIVFACIMCNVCIMYFT